MRSRRVLQFHTPQGTKSGAGTGIGVGYKEVVKDEGPGSEEYESHA